MSLTSTFRTVKVPGWEFARVCEVKRRPAVITTTTNAATQLSSCNRGTTRWTDFWPGADCLRRIYVQFIAATQPIRRRDLLSGMSNLTMMIAATQLFFVASWKIVSFAATQLLIGFVNYETANPIVRNDHIFDGWVERK